MVNYEVIVTSVHDRADLLERTLDSMIPRLDYRPERILVHEVVRSSHPFVAARTEDMLNNLSDKHALDIQLIRSSPGKGLARGLRWLLWEAKTEFVLYTQEDFDFVRPIPVARCLEIATKHGMNQVRFNKRKTMAIKGADRPPHEQWKKVEIEYDGQKFCISDRWYHQASLWRRELALRGYTDLLSRVPDGKILERCEDRFDHWINTNIGQGAGSVDGNQLKRDKLCRTFIWGVVGEPAFIKHTGDERRTQGWG